MSVKARIGPSILNSNLANLGGECLRMMKCEADYLHLDVMDGHFVPNLTFGHPVVKCIRDAVGPDVELDVHLMVSNPEKWVKGMSEAGANNYTFHYEACKDPQQLIKDIQSSGMRAGVAIKPGTPVKCLIELMKVQKFDIALVMTVEPGFGGQSFMVPMMDKVKQLRQNFPSLDIEVDGGVSPKTIHHCAEAGANMIVSGSAIMKSSEPAQVIEELRNSVISCMAK